MIEYAWISKLLRDVAFTWRPRELSLYVKKMTYFKEFCYLNSSCIRKSITSIFMSSSKNKFTDVSVGFRPPCCSSSGSMASPYIWVKHFFRYLLYEIFLWPEYWRDSLHIYLLSFPRFWTLSIELFWLFFFIYFEWRDTENQQYAWIARNRAHLQGPKAFLLTCKDPSSLRFWWNSVQRKALMRTICSREIFTKKCRQQQNFDSDLKEAWH